MTSFLDEWRGMQTAWSGAVAQGDPLFLDLFDADAPVFVARAPARLDLMGGIADYSGSMVLEWPLAEAVMAATQRRPRPEVRVVSLPNGDRAEPLSVVVPLDLLRAAARDPAYAVLASRFAPATDDHWAAYVLGALPVLMRRAGGSCEEGCSILIASSVPEGKGVASSAALEVAVMRSVAAAYGMEVDDVSLGIWCQEVENLIAGAPCGVMDQLTASCARAGHLLALLCQPADVQGHVPLPEPLRVWGLDSGERHCVAGADYGSVRTGAFMGYRILADHAGLSARTVAPGRVLVEDPKWKGYLANVGARSFERRLRRHLPERISGAEFLARWGGITDSVTSVDPARDYAVCAPTAHPIFEHARVERFRELLAHAESAEARRELGALMYASHQSYAACGLSSKGTERLVQLVAERGAGCGLLGAKITGGGSGGTVAVLGEASGESAIDEVRARYEEATGHRPHCFRGSSDGAGRSGVLRGVPGEDVATWVRFPAA